MGKRTKQEIKEDKRFAAILKEHRATNCPNCAKKIDRNDISWNNPSTEAGTPFCVIDIICIECKKSIAHVNSWYPSIEDFDEVLYVLERDW